MGDKSIKGLREFETLEAEVKRARAAIDAIGHAREYTVRQWISNATSFEVSASRYYSEDKTKMGALVKRVTDMLAAEAKAAGEAQRDRDIGNACAAIATVASKLVEMCCKASSDLRWYARDEAVK